VATPTRSKAAWRRELRARLARVDDPAGAGAAIRRGLEEFLARTRPERVASFAALPGEPELLPLLSGVTPARWALPRVEGDRLILHQVAATAELEAAAYGILEPRADSPRVDPATIDLFLCPGLGFDRLGTRLGRGMGYYDRLLAAARPGVPRLGVAFPEALVDELPAEAHDLPMTHLATPDGVIALT